jgi:hypothetical protein
MISTQVFETTLLSMLGLDDVLQNFRVDPLLGVLSEASKGSHLLCCFEILRRLTSETFVLVIAVPSVHCHQGQSKNGQDQFPQLSRCLKAMEEALTKRIVGCADVPNLSESIHVLITLKFINNLLQRERKNVAGEIAALLGESTNLKDEFISSLSSRLAN